MIARRDIEQQIADVSQKDNHKDAMNWFESMTNYLNGSNNILLKIVSKLFMNNLITAYSKYDHNVIEDDRNENEEIEEHSGISTKYQVHAK